MINYLSFVGSALSPARRSSWARSWATWRRLLVRDLYIGPGRNTSAESEVWIVDEVGMNEIPPYMLSSKQFILYVFYW